jgi:hypothetical protein
MSVVEELDEVVLNQWVVHDIILVRSVGNNFSTSTNSIIEQRRKQVTIKNLVIDISLASFPCAFD